MSNTGNRWEWLSTSESGVDQSNNRQSLSRRVQVREGSGSMLNNEQN